MANIVANWQQNRGNVAAKSRQCCSKLAAKMQNDVPSKI
jgi:hypothetical protein